MNDFSEIWIDFECPNCNYLDDIQLIDIKAEKEIFCHNCKCEIRLNDHDGSVYNSIENINNAKKKLENLLKFGK